MNKSLLWTVVALVIIGGLVAILSQDSTEDTVAPSPTDHKDAEYVIEGERVKLLDGMAVSDLDGDSSTKITTKYFGNELKTDLNADGKEDIAFILTQDRGGSGIFYYAVAAISTDVGYVGSDGYLLGDRIAPQSTNLSTNPKHKNVVVFNYADRAPGEAMATQPTVGKSVYLKIDPNTLQWGIVVPDFEGESASGIKGVAMLGPTCPVTMYPPDPQCNDRPYQTSLVVTTADQAQVIKTVSTDENGRFSVELSPGRYAIRSAAAANILPYCASNDVIQVKPGLFTEVTVSCDTGIR